MKKEKYDFRRTAALIRAFSTRLFSSAVFDFCPSDASDLDDLLFDAYLAFLCDSHKALVYAEKLMLRTPELYELLIDDAESIYSSDPAASCLDEVIFCYPGFFATMCYRFAHCIYLDGVTVLARFISEYAHSLTGIDIHPGARIGERFAIDHGTGVVIGETSVIGCDVRIYQGVTIGAKSFPRAEDGSLDRTKKRHPTIGDGCTVYANATILGGDTVIGDGSVIGANVWITDSVPRNSKVYYGRK